MSFHAAVPRCEIFISGSLFGLESANGGLRITTSHPDVKVTSRTYNLLGEGNAGGYAAGATFGQFLGPAEDIIAS